MYERLYEWFVSEAAGDDRMPIGIAKARLGDPDEWILEKL
jgi:hypothetical protein